jgi:hypothetical protein
MFVCEEPELQFLDNILLDDLMVDELEVNIQVIIPDDEVEQQI